MTSECLYIKIVRPDNQPWGFGVVGGFDTVETGPRVMKVGQTTS